MPFLHMDDYNQKIGILIPAYNPQIAALQELISRLERICRQLNHKILIVDDGSNAPLQHSLSDLNEITIIRHRRNSGKGVALKTGFNYFLTRFQADLIITLDADLQHPPESIPEFINCFKKNNTPIIIGNRINRTNKMPIHRIFSNNITSFIISRISRQKIKDSQCGFRLIKSSILREIELTENRFHLESELVLKAGLQGYPVDFVNIPTIYTNQKSSINNFSDSLNFLTLILKILYQKATGKCIPLSEIK